MIVAVSGSRTIKDIELVSKILSENVPEHTVKIIEGACSGGSVDDIAHVWADSCGYETQRYPAKWRKPDGTIDYDAGFKRNAEMADIADFLIAIWDGRSKGTNHMVNCMKARGKQYVVIKVK